MNITDVRSGRLQWYRVAKAEKGAPKYLTTGKKWIDRGGGDRQVKYSWGKKFGGVKSNGPEPVKGEGKPAERVGGRK